MWKGHLDYKVQCPCELLLDWNQDSMFHLPVGSRAGWMRGWEEWWKCANQRCLLMTIKTPSHNQMNNFHAFGEICQSSATSLKPMSLTSTLNSACLALGVAILMQPQTYFMFLMSPIKSIKAWFLFSYIEKERFHKRTQTSFRCLQFKDKHLYVP